MKYIKVFENFNQLQDIKDIFVELQDNGYTISVHNGLEGGVSKHLNDSFSISIYKFLRFDKDYVREYVLMFIDYMNEVFGQVDLWYEVTTIYQEKINFKSYDVWSIPCNDEIISLDIFIKK
jgi:hypothetical protein